MANVSYAIHGDGCRDCPKGRGWYAPDGSGPIWLCAEHEEIVSGVEGWTVELEYAISGDAGPALAAFSRVADASERLRCALEAPAVAFEQAIRDVAATLDRGDEAAAVYQAEIDRLLPYKDLPDRPKGTSR
jgi:hypothetical protein